MRLNTNPPERKDMVTALSRFLDEASEYLNAPTFAYRIGAVTVNADGTLDCDDAAVTERITPLLTELGWLQAETTGTAGEGDSEASAVPTETVVKTYMPNSTIPQVRNVIRQLYSRQELINRMLRMENLYIAEDVITMLDETRFLNVSDLETSLHDAAEQGRIKGLDITGGGITLTMPLTEEMRWRDYGQLLDAIVRHAQEVNDVRITEIHMAGNDKYYANAWLNSLGFGGKEHKELRHNLMAHLPGYAAFRNAESMQKHKDRLAEQRRIAHEMND